MPKSNETVPLADVLFADLFDQLSGIAVVFDADLRVLRHNAALPGDFVGTHFADVLSPSQADILQRIVDGLAEVGDVHEQEGEAEVAGALRSYAARFTRLTEAPALYWVHAHDISERLEGEEMLAQSERQRARLQQLQTLATSAKHVDGFLQSTLPMLQNAVGASGVRLLVGNGSARKVVSAHPSTLSTGPLAAALSDQLTPAFAEDAQEVRLERPSQVRPGEDAATLLAQPVGALSPRRVLLLERARPFTDDETARIRELAARMGEACAGLKATTELTLSEERFRTLVTEAPDAIVLLDLDTGLFVEANPQAQRLFRCTRDELLEVGPGAVSPTHQPDGRVSRDAAMEHILAATQQTQVFEWMHMAFDSTPVLCEVRLSALPHDERRLIRGSMVDISDRKRAEREREELEAQLRQAQKMETVGQLTGGVAHDFNNLLTVVLGNLELLRMEADDHDAVMELSEQALEGARRGASLTQRLLAFARKQALQPKAINMNRVVASMEPLLRRTLGEHIEIETVQAAGLWNCFADPAQVENAVLNLCINARDAMPKGGKLTIETGNMRLDREYAEVHEEVAPGQYVMLAVTDCGGGIPADMLGKVFDPFFTTKDVGKGSGLGLSMVYGFTKQSGGHIKLYSEEGEGTAVKLYLPKAKEEAPRPTAKRTHEAADGQGEVIIVVEDDDGVRQLTVGMLRRIGYRPVSFADAESALAHMQDPQQPVDLLLTDVVLPDGINGVQLAERARQLRPGLKVVFMSGYTENAIIHHGRLDPGVELVEKPFTRLELAHRIREALLRDADADADGGPTNE